MTRRHLVTDIIQNYPEIGDLDYETMMSMDILQFNHMIEQRKIETRMNRSARMI